MSGAPAVTRWWWVRHAPVNSGGRIYGASDVDADCSEAALFAALARGLPEPAVWLTSHLRRTRQTAEAILAQRAAREAWPALIAHQDLAEQSFGDWQGMTYAEMEASRGRPKESYWLTMAEERPPGGESFLEMVERVSAAIQRLTAEHRGQDIVAVTHGGTIRAALALALKLEPARALAFSVDNCSLTRIDHIATDDKSGGDESGGDGPGGAWRVAAVNLGPDS